MLKPHRLFLALTLLCLADSASLATDFGNIAVTVAPVALRSRSHGYVEYRVAVTNRASQTAHHVKLTIPGSGYGGQLEEVSRAVTVQPSSTLIVSLFVPALYIYGNGLGVSIDGRRESEVVSVNIVDPGDARPSIMISQAANRKGFNVPAPVSGASSSTSSGAVLGGTSGTVSSGTSSTVITPTGVTLQFSTPTTIAVSEWPENWLGYSSFDCVVATGDEIRALPANVSSALWQYVKCGGTLLVVGTVDVPEAWRIRLKERAQIPTYYVGYGQCLVAPRETAAFSQHDWTYLFESCTKSQFPFQGAEAFAPADANRVFPVVDKLGVPVRGLFLLMLVFVVVIGPVNLMVLSRKKKKIWLLWTVPAISLITCVAVSAYTIMSEGWSGKARTAGLTILDETSHQATTIGWSAFYSPLTPGDGLRYGNETELTPQLGFQYGYGRGQNARRIDWTEGQHLTSGWVMARVPAHFKIRKSETRRERITVNRGPDGALSVVNGLGVDLRELWLADRDGRMYSAKALKAGASAVLALEPNRRAYGIVEELRLAFAGSMWFELGKWTDSPERLLLPGCYIAAVDSSPFIEEGLRDVGSRTSESVVYGIMKLE